MAASVANEVVKTMLGVMGLAVMAAMLSTVNGRSFCGNGGVKVNVTLKDILGDWYVSQYSGFTSLDFKGFSVTGLQEDNNNNTVTANVTVYGIKDPNPKTTSFKVYSFKDKPGEIIVKGLPGQYCTRTDTVHGNILILRVWKNNRTQTIVAKENLLPSLLDLLQSSSTQMPSTTSSASSMRR